MKNIKLNYLLIPILAIMTSATGQLITNQTVNTWYTTLNLPSIAPSGGFIGAVWTVLYILVTIYALIAWNTFKRDHGFYTIIILLLLNAFMNSFWSFLFFGAHNLPAALIEMTMLNATTFILIMLSWKRSKFASLLLVPYFIWVAFATYLTYIIWILN